MLHIFTLNWNGKDKLERLYPGLNDNIANLGLDAIWHVKDNGSKDDSVSFLSKIPNSNNFRTIPYCYDHNRDNFSKGMNYLYEQSQPKDNDLILFLNNDVQFFDKLSLKKIISLQDDSKCDVVGSKLLYTGTNKLQHAGVIFSTKYNLMPYHFRPNEDDDINSSKNRYFQSVTAAVALVTASSFSSVGGFDESFNWAFEDIDLFLRIGKLKKDNVVYCGETKIYHDESSTLKKNPVNKMFLNSNVKNFKNKCINSYYIDHDYYLKDINYRLYA